MQHPEVLVVVKLFPVRRGKLSTKHPELTPTLGNYHRLKERWEGKEGRKGGRNKEEGQSEIKRVDVL